MVVKNVVLLEIEIHLTNSQLNLFFLADTPVLERE